MSIRLRLSLIYTVILALTLIIFSTLLYFSQVRLTERDFRGRLAENVYSSLGPPRPPPRQRPRPWGPSVFTQIRDLEGAIIERGRNWGDAFELPLSEDGLLALQQGKTWVERMSIDGERFLVHSRPVKAPNGETRIIQVAGSLSDRDSYLGVLRNILFIGSCISTLFAFGVGWVLAGLTLRPINRIRQTAQAIGVDRDFDRRVDYTGPKDEVGQLATTFNDMLTELQAAYRQVEQSLRVQQRFVADASHELRTPLTTLRGNIALLQRDPPLDNEEQSDILTDMEDESERLIRLINNLLALARADAKRPLRREPVQLKPLLEDVCQQLKVMALGRMITCGAPLDVKIWGDQDALKQVLLILLDNGLTHTPPEANISMTAELAGPQVVIRVQDDGPGIEPDLLPHIFDRFYQGDTARTGSGTGLGLAIAKELVEAQEGTIAVESQLGQGTVFILAFPNGSILDAA